MKRIATMSLALVALVATLGAVSLAETKSDYDHRYRLAPGSTWGFRTQSYLKSTLVMDVYDARTNQLVWRGFDTKSINYNKADKTINDAVGHLMKRFRHDLKVRES